MKITEHFDTNEIKCKCGCNGIKYDISLYNKLEELRTSLGSKPIYISSGYRCPNHSIAVGGSSSDAHTKGIAVDIRVEGYTSYDIAEKAEQLGFSGIGIIDNDYCHVDIRNNNNYVNNHWYGNEMTGDNNIETFQRKKAYTNSFTLNGRKFKITIEEE